MQPEPGTSALTEVRSSALGHSKYVGIYWAICFGITWLIWLPGILGKDGLGWLSIDPSMPVVISAGTIGPLLATYITHRLQTGSWRAVRFLPTGRTKFLWLLLGPLLVWTSWFVVFPALISKGSLSEWHWHPSALTSLLVPMFNYNLFGGPLFEEFGWRGFLQPRLQRLLPPWIASALVGLIWASWHLPLFLFRDWTSASILAFFLIEIGLATVMAFAFNSSGQAIVVAILMHAAFNASARFLGRYLDRTPLRDHPSEDLMLAAAFILTALMIVLLTRGRVGTNAQVAAVT